MLQLCLGLRYHTPITSLNRTGWDPKLKKLIMTSANGNEDYGRLRSSAKHDEEEAVHEETGRLGADEDDLGAGRASYGDDLDTLDRRRTEELKLIGEFDSASINPRRECWFLVDTKWLQSWAKFVRGQGPPPGRISNEVLVEDNLKTPREGLVSRVDYRGVNPAVWFLYLEMYGKDSAQDICRYVIDIDEGEVPLKYMKQICEEPRRKAQVEVQKMRWRVEPEDVRLPEKPQLCCCITERTIDCLFIGLFTCCIKWRRRCPCLCCCCPGLKEGRAGNATGGRYTRVTDNGDLDDDSDFSDDDVFGGSKDGRGQNGTNGTRNSPSVEMSTRR